MHWGISPLLRSTTPSFLSSPYPDTPFFMQFPPIYSAFNLHLRYTDMIFFFENCQLSGKWLALQMVPWKVAILFLKIQSWKFGKKIETLRMARNRTINNSHSVGTGCKETFWKMSFTNLFYSVYIFKVLKKQFKWQFSFLVTLQNTLPKKYQTETYSFLLKESGKTELTRSPSFELFQRLIVKYRNIFLRLPKTVIAFNLLSARFCRKCIN